MPRPPRSIRPFHRLRREEGFTVAETMLALGVILASLVSLAYTATVGFSHISYARQRQSASGFANQAMEQIRALPFDTLKKGLGNADLGAMSDPLIVHSGVDYLYGAEKIPHGDNPTQAPLVPHRTTITNGTATAYTIAAYVTYYNNQLTSNTFRVTVRVAWTAKGKPSSVQAQSIFYSGSGCLSPATHPFAAPCQPFLFASAVADEGGIGFTGSISGVDFQEANLLLPGQTSDAQIEQISSVQGSSTPSGVTLTTAAQGKQSAGALKLISGADNDPAQPGLDFESVSVAPAAASVLQTIGGGGGYFEVSSSASDTGASVSTTSAAISPPHPCPNLLGINEADALSCGNSNSKQAGTAFAQAGLSGNAKKAGDIMLAQVGAASSPSVSFTDRAGAPEASACLQTTTDGCVHSDVVRSWGQVTLAGLPNALGSAPSGWAGYLVRVTGATASATSEEGLGAAKPIVAVAGTISYWTGAGYSQLIVAPGAAVSIPVAPAVASAVIDGKTMVVNIAATVSTGGTLIDDPAGCLSSCTRNSASATAASPLVGTITYSVTYDGVQQMSMTMTVDLGSALAKGTYQPSPSG